MNANVKAPSEEKLKESLTRMECKYKVAGVNQLSNREDRQFPLGFRAISRVAQNKNFSHYFLDIDDFVTSLLTYVQSS